MNKCESCYNMECVFVDNQIPFFDSENCQNYRGLTNADRIRSMSDEELAFYIVNHPMWSDESACVAWLKEPIMEGESENPN